MPGDIRIPSSIEDSALEDTVLKLFRKFNVLSDPSTADDCHLLKSNIYASRKVIIRSSKQKDIYRVLKFKSNFKNADVTENGIPPNSPTFANQGLFCYYKFLWPKCKKPWLNNVIELFWVSKGSCQIILIDNQVKTITHI